MSAVDASHATSPAWVSVSPAQKRDIFLRTATIFESRSEELTKYMILETGASEFGAEFNVRLAADILNDVAGRISSITGSAPITDEPATSAIVYREPYGVILAIAPWNGPDILGVRGIAYAPAAGNTAILRASGFSPRCTWAIADGLERVGYQVGR